MNKVITLDEAVSKIKDGMTIMVGGFLGNGSPHKLIEALVENGVSNLTLICNDTAFTDYGVGKMVVNNQFKRIITSHVGTNRETGRQLNERITEVELVPQGTLAEQIRAGGAGLGGILTPTGIGTIVEEGKDKIVIDNKEYLIEKPLRADVAIIAGSKVDEFGNVYYEGSTRNFNSIMATAADIVIVEAEEVVEVGMIKREDVVTPGIFIDFIVWGGNE
ncbi:3-oxoacid CoA-transferase subunit A [Clostridium sp. PL3]|uniref:3-oxoacid CoA-transferase subunit A n=1 Tax=Clostridium thailandense TaxID=2794346 RepID=A0A949U2X1_9CLOT|nr:3-oxoacid CoA-transferase subunit A [Clostridium thailandense]MBV7276406.1 3-oxoacid CoA-transferase subunit A [Clostridium thailandense]